MKKKKYLPLYYKWMEQGLPCTGLCLSLEAELSNHAKWRFIRLFKPSGSDVPSEYIPGLYWGSGFMAETKRNMTHIRFKLTPLRETMLLLMAAMNDEL